MTIITPTHDIEYETRYWLNQTPLPPTEGDIYNIPCLDKMFKVKKAADYPFGSVAGFTQEGEVMATYFYPFINKDSILIDAGAAWGAYSLRALSIGAQVKAFEPDPRCCKALNNNIDLNNFRDRFTLHEVALGDENNTTFIFELEDVPQRTLDSYDYKPTFIKIDVEGLEGLVIAGAQKTLEKYHPKILIENHGYLDTVLNLSHDMAEAFLITVKNMVSIINKLEYKIVLGPIIGKTYFTFCY